jgi:hypothetical protein
MRVYLSLLVCACVCLGNVKTMQSIQPGSVLLLKNVTVLKLSAEADPCIIVTNENITKIID